MSNDDPKTAYLQRAGEARSKAASASNFMVMDEYMDIAAAWRALAAEADQLAARRKSLETPVSILTRPAAGSPRMWGRFGPAAVPQSAAILKHPMADASGRPAVPRKIEQSR